MLKLVIANKNYSSWSMRPWVLLKHFGIAFEEAMILLGQDDTSQNILKICPSGRVPVLADGDVVIWDSLAICEYVAEKYPELNLWPKDSKARATARAMTAEMHSGFAALRQECTMNIRRKVATPVLSDLAKLDIERINKAWQSALEISGGPFLFGAFSIADAFYAPVVTRFQSYSLPTTSGNQAYMQRVLEAAGVRDWLAEAFEETSRVAKYDK